MHQTATTTTTTLDPTDVPFERAHPSTAVHAHFESTLLLRARTRSQQANTYTHKVNDIQEKSYHCMPPPPTPPPPPPPSPSSSPVAIQPFRFSKNTRPEMRTQHARACVGSRARARTRLFDLSCTLRMCSVAPPVVFSGGSCGCTIRSGNLSLRTGGGCIAIRGLRLHCVLMIRNIIIFVGAS